MSVRRIAVSLGVSPATVSMALRNDPKIPLATRRRVQKAADCIGYRPDAKIAERMSRIRHHRSVRPQAGFEENQQLVGAWAVELLTARIMNRDLGVPTHPRIETIKSRWTDGPSLRSDKV